MAETQLVGNLKDLMADTTSSTSANRNAGKKDLGKDAFLQLLVAQLKNQDPQKPMDDTSFIAEMAQFSSLEQMQNLNQTMTKQQQFQSLTQASGMIGKYVSLQDSADNSMTITGQVSEVRSNGSTVNVVIDGKEYDSSTITNVSDKPLTGAAGSATTTTTASTGTSS
jgi:flagellar basal-body rod modification protein FlgD